MPATWSHDRGRLAATSFTDSGLGYSTPITTASSPCRVPAVQPRAWLSARSRRAQPDVLAGAGSDDEPDQGASLSAGRSRLSRTRIPRPRQASFVATINWGNGRSSLGTVSGSDGTFTVTGTHVFPRVGRSHESWLTVTMTSPDPAQVVDERYGQGQHSSRVSTERLTLRRSLNRRRTTRRPVKKHPAVEAGLRFRALSDR